MGSPKAVISLMCPLTITLLTVSLAVYYLIVDEALLAMFLQQ